ncbi:MAG: AbgT family transporter [Deltaproteobacteria bacterium]|nr:MAG: AbgT family transporter [Deltaproteobacteria bacterium]
MSPAAPAGPGGVLEWVERIGNRLPDPSTLFLAGALTVMLASQLAASLGWTVEKTIARDMRAPVLDARGAPVVDPATGAPVSAALTDPATGEIRRELSRVSLRATSLLSADGVFWALRNMVSNFIQFPPLGIVLVGMLGIGLAERTGFVGALLKATLLAVPAPLLTPTVFFVGVMSSLGLDAGYVVLPPVAAALYKAVGRSPLVGLAAVFAGVSAGFSANLLITAVDPLLAGFSQAGARILDARYEVAATANWWFMIASTLLLTGVGWGVTARIVEPRFGAAQPATAQRRAGGPEPLTSAERRGLLAALAAAGIVATAVGAAVGVPGAPLYGAGVHFDRWIEAIIALLFLGFFVPGLVYGVATGSLRSDRDVARTLGDTMAGMGPYIVLAFFAAQFIEYFRYSGLGEMLAIAGGQLLSRAALPAPLLILAFVLVVAVGNLFIGSASAKYAFFAPVFVPMFMQVGISPELTQAAYRVGDSVSNVVTPLNPYLVIILVFMRRYAPEAGVGTLVALMLPYSIAFTAAWAVLLLVWMGIGLELGPAGPLVYAPELP